MMIHMVIDQVNRRLMQSIKLVDDAGEMAGCWIWILEVS
jgi:hypothetical protein